MTVATYKRIWSNKEEATKKAAIAREAREEFFNFSHTCINFNGNVGNTNSYSTARVRRSSTSPHRNIGRLTNYELKRSFERVLAQS